MRVAAGLRFPACRQRALAQGFTCTRLPEGEDYALPQRSYRKSEYLRREREKRSAAPIHSSRTDTLSVAPFESITVKRMKPAPSGTHAVFRRSSSRSTGAPLTSQVRGGAPPSALSASGVALVGPPARPRSIALPSSGKAILSVSVAAIPPP